MISASITITAPRCAAVPRNGRQAARRGPVVVARAGEHGGDVSEALSGEWPSNWSIASYEDLAEFYKDKLEKEVADKVVGTMIGDVMSTRLFTVEPSCPIDKIDFGPVSGMPVMVGENMVGIVSKKDVTKPGKTVEDIMTKRVVVTKSGVTVEQAAVVMLKYKVHRLPVVDDSAKLIGIVTRTDIFSAMEHDLGMA